MLSKNKTRKPRDITQVYTLDIETDAQGEVLDIGFYDGNVCLYFPDWKQLTEHLNTLGNAIIYAHNGGGFDYVNYLIWLFKNGIRFNAMLKQSKIFCLYLEALPHIKFVDSFCIFNTSLAKVAQSFTEFEKIDIDVEHYKDMRAFKIEHTRTYYDYLERDCVSLFQAIIKTRALVNEIYNIGDLPLSIGSISMKLYRKRFLNEKLVVPSQNEKDFTFRAYVGGRCEYLGFGKKRNGWYANVNGYDFNSHYPSQMLRYQFPIRRGVYGKRFFFDEHGEVTPGIYEIRFKQKHGRFPILKDEFGDYAFEGAGVYTHIEINEILRGGGTIELIQGYHYENTEAIFREFVTFFFTERLKAQNVSDEARDIFYKWVLNNLYGKFGQRDEVQSLQILHEQEARDRMDSATLNEFYRLDSEYSFYEVRETKKCFTSFPAIACMITAHARIALCQTLESCAHPIYCDTDSIHCQDDLSALTGNALGELKVEFYNARARYGGKKSYQIEHEKMKQKGIPSAVVDESFFDTLFQFGFNEVEFKRPLLLKSAIRRIHESPSKFFPFTRTVTLEKSFAEKQVCAA